MLVYILAEALVFGVASYQAVKMGTFNTSNKNAPSKNTSNKSVSSKSATFANVEQIKNVTNDDGLKRINVTVKNEDFLIDIAHKEVYRNRGLSGRKELGSNEGMLFVFDTDDYWGFWMKDMLIPLDMIWLDASGKVVYIEKRVAPETFPKAFIPTTKARYVFEVASGTADRLNIVEGDMLISEIK